MVKCIKNLKLICAIEYDSNWCVRFAARLVNTTAIAGQNVTLVCNASGPEPVIWWYKDQLGSEEREVAVNGEVDDIYRMTVVDYNLVIHNVMPNDTGVYTCVEKTGFGEHHKISLTVSGILRFFRSFFSLC